MFNGGNTRHLGGPEVFNGELIMAFDNTAYMNNLAANAQNIGTLGYTGFGQPTQVDANPWQQTAWQNTFNRGMQGAEEVSAARNQLTNTINGGYLNQQATQGPAAGFNQYANAMNPYANVQNQNANIANPFASMSNPYLTQSIDSALGDVARNYNLAVKPQTEAAMARSGSFGNSGLQQMQQEQQRQLGQTMGDMANRMRMDAYNQAAGLTEAQMGRMYNAGESAANRRFTAGSEQLNNMYNAGQQQTQNNFNAGQSWAQRQDALRAGERGYQMQSILGAPSFANSDYTDLQAMQQAGNALQGQSQAERTAAYNQYLDAREWPFKTLGAQSSALGTGGVGSASYQQQQSNTGANVLGGALSGAMLGNSLGFGSGWGALGGGLLGLL